MIDAINDRLGKPGRIELSSLLEGQDALLLPQIVTNKNVNGLVYICHDDSHLAALGEQLAYFAPDVETIRFPAWDCLPYDRVSPSADIVSRRLSTLGRLEKGLGKNTILLTTVNAVLHRVLPRKTVASASFLAKPGMAMGLDSIVKLLSDTGYTRVGTVVEQGDFAVRGGLLDLYPPGHESPVRLDFFGDTLESIRQFDAQTQRSTASLKVLALSLANEVLLNADSIAQFRKSYAQAFGGMDLHDPLYESITSARRYQGMEHWLPLFHSKLETLFDYLPDATWMLGNEVSASLDARHEQVAEYFDARKDALAKSTYGGAPYKPLPTSSLYLTQQEWNELCADRTLITQSPFESPSMGAISLHGRQGRSFAAERSAGQGQVYDAVKTYVDDLRKAGTRTLIACWSEGSADRLASILHDHELAPLVTLDSWAKASAIETTIAGIIVLPIERGFEAPGLAIISEQDILGDRLVRRARKAKKAADFISELASLSPGDLMVHVDHGIGRFEGLRIIEVQGAPHDCLQLTYADNARLFLPVENLELLSRYGSETDGVNLDRLGGGAWQAKKAKLKQRIREIAGDLIKTAAARELKPGDIIAPAEGAFDEFCARFPYEETEDQLSAIEAVLEDLQAGRPMDRLICGDVGFGKTEVALRAAFVAAYAGKQVAVVVPTTLLSRQHFKTFTARFKGIPLRIAQASRLVPRKELELTKKELEAGAIDIIIGTHALLADSIKFRDLGLMIVDEEQHFGVKHKERLKQMRANVHVLTLSATPIPRTLQLALSGLREMSLITTPPLDRLAVRTYIAPFDPVVIREYLLREHFRGGQSFYVVPRITDLEEIGEFLREAVPEIKFRTAHGRMVPTELEDIMTGFYDRAFDVLLSTTIVESGLDVSTANTLVIHRADMFGLAQLYQLRGRVGRSKSRAYALFTTQAGKPLNPMAERRLKVLQSLDSLGAGFNLASHDLDIRGAGNLLGEEQHGNIREVGFELYQSMLEDEVAAMRSGGAEATDDGQWSPSINIGTAVLIPESYVTDLQARLGLYRRLADFEDQQDLDGFAAELHDRFGKRPDEVDHLLEIVSIKLLCRKANVEKVDAGPKGVTITFRKGIFAKPQNLVQWISSQGSMAKLRGDMSLVLLREWATAAQRLKGTRQMMQSLVKLAS